MTNLHGFGPRRVSLPLRRGAVDFTDDDGVAAMLGLIGDAPLPPVTETADEPFIGVTTDGTSIEGLYPATDEGGPTSEAAKSATDYLGLLDSTARAKAVLPVDSPEWQLWTNAFLTFDEHGLLLQELTDAERGAALDVIAASFSAAGYQRAREAMRLNGALGRLVGRYDDTLTEYCYWLTIFGEPSEHEPWGWQLQGHHVDLHCLFLNGQVVITPTFLGCEFDGDSLFREHRGQALELIGSLDNRQRDRALLYGSMLAPELPPDLAGPVDGRHRAGAGRDNLVLPYVGLAGRDLSAGQRELMLKLLDVYIEALPPRPREARRTQIDKHLDQTHLAWIGGWDEAAPFYYRLHSPVILVEYDNHPGVFLDNDHPEPFHVHTIVRSPNGGDYGKSLLRQHYTDHH